MRVKLHEFGRPDLEVDEEVRQFFAEQLAARDDALAAEEDAHRATSAKLSEASATTAKLTERVANVEKEAKEVRRKARFAELQDPRRGAKMLKAEEEAMTQLFNENEALFDSIMKARPTLAAMSGTPAGGTLPGGAADTAQARFDAAVEAVKRERRITFSEAFDAVCKEQPSLHAEYKAERDRDRGPMPGSNYVPAGEVV